MNVKQNFRNVIQLGCNWHCAFLTIIKFLFKNLRKMEKKGLLIGKITTPPSLVTRPLCSAAIIDGYGFPLHGSTRFGLLNSNPPLVSSKSTPNLVDLASKFRTSSRLNFALSRPIEFSP